MDAVKRFYPKKITTALIGLKTEILQAHAESKAQTTPAVVARFYGRITKTETLTGTYGPYTRYNGEFEAVNAIDGSIHRSRTLLVPPVVESVLDEMIAGARQSDPNASVEFGVDLNVEFYDNPNKTGTKFRFSASPLIEPTEEDTVSKLGKMFAPIGPVQQIEGRVEDSTEPAKKETKKK